MQKTRMSVNAETVKRELYFDEIKKILLEIIKKIGILNLYIF